MPYKPPGNYGSFDIHYDDQILDIIQKINTLLQQHDLVLEDDGKEHDGYIVYTLVKK